MLVCVSFCFSAAVWLYLRTCLSLFVINTGFMAEQRSKHTVTYVGVGFKEKKNTPRPHILSAADV